LHQDVEVTAGLRRLRRNATGKRCGAADLAERESETRRAVRRN
jgi:hypothetical protein